MKKRNFSAVKLVKISKKYLLKHEKSTLMGRFFGQDRKEEFFALNNISLNIKQGERVGILGPNGSGKTTLLKIIAGISTPSQGRVEVNGKIVSLIDLSAGFNPELTGESNIVLNGLLIGMTKKEISSSKQKIIDFADIGNFINSPLYTYSQGMKLRLGLSIAIHSNPEILLLDEGIAVGDHKFRQKTLKKIREMSKEGKTIIIATHWFRFIQSFCNKVFLIEKGKIVDSGDVSLLKKYDYKI
jgi:teichoic acid transport system ATP-binding protein